MKLGLFVCGMLCGCLCDSGVSIDAQSTIQSGTTAPSSPAASAPRLPEPPGPYGIGRVGYDWTDATRPDRFASNPATHRELMVYFWYPTRKKAEGVKGIYLPGAAQMDRVPEIERGMREEFEGN